MPAASDPQLTALIESFRRTIRRGVIDPSRVNTLRDEIIEVYRHREVPVRREGDIRVLFNFRSLRGYGIPALVPAGSALFTDDQEANVVGDPSDVFVWKFIRRSMLAGFLYADQVADLDPLSFEEHFAPPGSDDHFPGLVRLVHAFEALAAVQPLIEAGLLVMVPIVDQDLPIDDPDEEAAWAHYVADSGLALGGRADTVDRWYLRDALRAARHADATLVPRNQWEWQYLECLLKRGRTESTDHRVVSALASVELPMFAGAPARTLIAIHQAEQSFIEWRAALRNASRLVASECRDASFESEAREVLNDLLQPAAHAVQRATRRSKVLASVANEQPLKMSLGALFGLGAGLATGKSALAAAGLSTTSALATALANLSFAAVRRPKAPEGTGAIISLLADSK